MPYYYQSDNFIGLFEGSDIVFILSLELGHLGLGG